MERIPVALRALAAQLTAVLLVFGGATQLVTMPLAAPSRYVLVLIEGAIAALISQALRLPRWWLPIQFAFGPLVVFALEFRVDPQWYLTAFLALALVFGAVHASRVPLFLSSGAAIARLLAHVPGNREIAFLDLGCGLGGVLSAVSAARPRARCAGIEAAPLPWTVAVLRGNFPRRRFRVRYGSFWNRHLGQWDVVFAYLSPAAMPRLWTKAKHEMKPGCLLISNSFPIPGVSPTGQERWGDSSGKALFIYRI